MMEETKKLNESLMNLASRAEMMKIDQTLTRIVRKLEMKLPTMVLGAGELYMPFEMTKMKTREGIWITERR